MKKLMTTAFLLIGLAGAAFSTTLPPVPGPNQTSFTALPPVPGPNQTSFAAPHMLPPVPGPNQTNIR